MIFVIDVILEESDLLRCRTVVSVDKLLDGVESEDVEKLVGVNEDEALLLVTALYVLGKEVETRNVDEENVRIGKEGRVAGEDDVIFFVG